LKKVIEFVKYKIENAKKPPQEIVMKKGKTKNLNYLKTYIFNENHTQLLT